MDEIELIQQLKEGNEQAFKTLVETYQDLVFNTAIGIVQNAEDAEDVAQETFIKVFRSVHTFKGESKISTWLYRITVSTSLDLLRSKKSKKRFSFLQRLFGDENEPLYEIPDFNHPGVALDQKENAALLFKAIARLPENQKVAFTLNKVEELSYQEVAEVMKISISAVESLMHRAKQNLKKILERKEDL